VLWLYVRWSVVDTMRVRVLKAMAVLFLPTQPPHTYSTSLPPGRRRQRLRPLSPSANQRRRPRPLRRGWRHAWRHSGVRHVYKLSNVVWSIFSRQQQQQQQLQRTVNLPTTHRLQLSIRYDMMVFLKLCLCFFTPCTVVSTRGHRYKVYKKSTSGVCSHFFCERVVNVWNKLPSHINFSSRLLAPSNAAFLTMTLRRF